MLLFSTILSVKEALTKEDFIKLVIEWNQGSPHKENIIPDIKWNGERNIKYGSEELWLGIEEYRNIIAVRYEKKESDGTVWDTDYVLNFDERRLAVRLDRSYLETAFGFETAFSNPHFISLLIKNGYLEPDYDLPVSDEPITVEDGQISKLAKVINGESKNKLPVVYVSKTHNDEDPVDVRQMAKRLKGIAHVLVQNNLKQNAKLRHLCDDKNEYFGAIGIYFPNKAIGHRRFLYRNYGDNGRLLIDKVVRNIGMYSNSQMLDMLYTWSGVNNALLRDKYSSQKAERLAAEFEKANTVKETELLIASVDEELAKLHKQVEQLTKANDALTCENAGLRAKLASSEELPILFLGDEDDFFPGEIKEIILDTLIKEQKNTAARTRRHDVLTDIVANNGYEGVFATKIERVKVELKDYKNMSAPTRKFLEDLGFVVSDEGKHYRLTYYGDARYNTTVAKTGSDSREGKNIAQTIIKNML